jgi:hypothetical protein
MLHCKTGIGLTPHRLMEDRRMSQQLTLSSMFSVLALAGLCMVAGARDLAGYDTPSVADSPYAVQAELAPGLLTD